MNRSISSIKHKASILNLKYYDPIYNNYFTKEEDEILLIFYEKDGINKCKKLLPHRTKESILRRARYLKLKNSVFYDENEIKIIEDQTLTDEEVSIMLKRSKSSIHSKRIKLGIINSKFKHKNWTTDEDKIIKMFYPSEGGNCCKRLSNKTEDDVRKRAKDLKIKSKARWNLISKKIQCVETKEIFNSIKEASFFISKKPNTISYALKSGGSAGGFHWTYLEEE